MRSHVRALSLLFGSFVAIGVVFATGGVQFGGHAGRSAEVRAAQGVGANNGGHGPYPGTGPWTTVYPHLQRVSTISATDAWAVGPLDDLYHYTGSQWVKVSTPEGDYSYLDIEMLSASSGWIAAINSAYAYDGNAWQDRSTGLRCQPGELCKSLMGISALSASDVWGFGVQDINYTMFHWDGTQWRVAGPVMPTNMTIFRDISMATASDGWIVGDNDEAWPPLPVAYHYSGGNWAPVAIPISNAYLYGVFAPVPGEVWITGGALGQGGITGVILHYVNGVWTSFQTPDSSIPKAITMQSTTTGWVATDRSVLAWNGSGWSVAYSSDTALNGVSAAAGQVWAVGQDFTTIRKTGSGGWVKVTGGPTSQDLQSISALNSSNIWAVGDKGTVLHYTGTSWQRVPVPADLQSHKLNSVQMLSSSEGYAVGDNVIAHWDGSAWSVISNTFAVLNSVYMTSAGNGWAVGAGGTILRATNGLWSTVASPATRDLNGVAMDSPSHGWAVGGDYADYQSHPALLEFTGGVWVDRTASLPAGAAVWSAIWLAPGGGDGWIVGSKCFGGAKSVMRLVGGSWVADPTADTAWNLYAVTPGESGQYWVFGGSGSQYIGGAWHQIGLATIDFIHGVAVLGHDGWAVGEHGTLLRYTPDGVPPSPTPSCPLPPTPPISPTPQLTTQAAGQHAVLVTHDSQAVLDTDIGQWLRTALMSGGVSKARDASFLFQECYGGGMLDDIRGVMGNTVRWLGASASTATELSYGSEHPPIGNTWTYALNPALQPAVDQPLLAAVATAAANDPARAYPTPETGQWMHGNGGETIRLQDRCAIRHYAILWAGYTSATTTWWPLPPRIDYNLRHYFDIQRIRDSLIANWSAAGGLYDITILYGDGIHRGDGQALPPEWHAQAATRDALAAAITRVGSLISSSDQFVFYASDHGSLSHDLQNGPQSLPGNGGQLVTRFSIAADELQTLANQPTNGQVITVSYDGPLDSDASVAVRVNDLTLGYLVSAGTTVELNVPNALLSTSNEVRLQSLNSQAIAITGLSFWDGPIESVPMPVPSQSPTAIPTPCFVQFTDVPASQPFYDFVRVLACRGIIGGYADGSFRPYNNVTRGQVTKFVVNAAALNDPIPATQQTFADVPASYPFWLYIERLAGRGYISGYTCGGAGEPCDSQARPYFRPGANLTRGQLAKIVANTGGYSEAVSGQLFEDVPATSPFYAYIERMALHNVISGYICGASPAGSCVQPGNRPYFAPGNNVTRGQTAKIVANTFYPGAPTP